ncbi:DUF6291 domain-containing protein [Segatella copri]|uniref:DUF6291 domain-containing protein n=1 Tax=Segatella copri TaxID=165179 RepID=A0AAW5IAL3_9BACT|nr:DUF6291 domain-containing protein [Segatella copri]MCP9546511.1 DUF6291 domain-containing protein [Segatella copri]MCP9549929.1 DUF6291 domain-containing protein [Segatella copri]MCP9556216.1 DUF6291 domain-containing protein [Segatella copri]MCP9570797.1 DUF6291 domain-containing protein [Segatella copri]
MSDSFIIYTSYLKIFEQLTDAQLGQLTRHMLSFAKTGKEPSIEDPLVKLSFAFIKDDMERNQRKYEEKCERLRANARKRWDKKQLDSEASEDMQKHTNVCKSMQKHANAQIAMHNDNEYVNDNVVSKETNILEPSKEGIQSASVKTEAPGGGKGSKSQKIDYAAVKEYWNRKHDETKSAMPPITLMTENRKVMVKARVRQCKGDVKTLYRVIDIAMASDFMNGNNKHGWLGKFDWIFGNEQNFAKVLEGNFNNEPAASQQPQSAAVKAQDPAATTRPSIGELYEQAKHQQPASQQSQDSKFRWVIQQNLEDLKKNPSNKPAKDSLTRYYEKGVLQRLGIDWKPEK